MNILGIHDTEFHQAILSSFDGPSLRDMARINNNMLLPHPYVPYGMDDDDYTYYNPPQRVNEDDDDDDDDDDDEFGNEDIDDDLY